MPRSNISGAECNACRKEQGLPLIKYSYRYTCEEHIKDIPEDIVEHVLGKVRGCNCVNCPRKHERRKIKKISDDECVYKGYSAF